MQFELKIRVLKILITYNKDNFQTNGFKTVVFVRSTTMLAQYFRIASSSKWLLDMYW